MKDIHKAYDSINSSRDLSKFIDLLCDDFCKNPKDWENDNLELFLRAMSAWVHDMDGFYINQNKAVPQQPSWRVVADILMGAMMYE